MLNPEISCKIKRRQINLLYSSFYRDLLRTENGYSKPGEIGRGDRQLCLLFPIFPLSFSMYAEIIFIDALEDVEEEIRVRGELL